MLSARATAHTLLARYGYTVRRTSSTADERYPDEFERIYAACRGFTMTSRERMYALYEATRYVSSRQIPGDVVECGVWRGGSVMLTAMTLSSHADPRDLWLYDTFSGMPKPTAGDLAADGAHIDAKWRESNGADDSSSWCLSSLDETGCNVRSTGYDPQRLHFVAGKVEDTIPAQMPERISLLRLDTDWHDSTLHELEHLFPLLSDGGVLLLDDYGRWKGQRDAVDKYFSQRPRPLFNRIDGPGRIAVNW